MARQDGGLIVKDARGRYALPTAEIGRRTANQLSAVISHTSAAAHWGWEMKVVPARPTVTVPRKRKVSLDIRTDVDVFWRTLAAGRVAPGQATPPLQTVIDCARWLPFDEALAIADSALRHRSVTREQLLAAAASSNRDRGCPAVVRVLCAADGRADNPFETALRAISLDVPGLRLVPQVEIRGKGRRLVRPDLVDERLRIVAEADSFEHHQRHPRGDRLQPLRQPGGRWLDRAAVRLGAGDVPAGLGPPLCQRRDATPPGHGGRGNAGGASGGHPGKVPPLGQASCLSSTSDGPDESLLPV